jgi:DNA-binding XRE family transcriptional regulator
MKSITISAEEYQALIDARDHAIAMRDVAACAPVLTEAEALAYLKAATPLAFWRKHRGISQADLAKAVGISQPYLAQMETGRRIGAVVDFAELARTLGVRIEDLLS